MFKTVQKLYKTKWKETIELRQKETDAAGGEGKGNVIECLHLKVRNHSFKHYQREK